MSNALGAESKRHTIKALVTTRVRELHTLIRMLRNTAFILFPWCLLVLQSYASFKYPVKSDRYGHSFLQHLADRAVAYGHLFKSASRSRNTSLSIDEVNQIVSTASTKYGVDPCLVESVVIYESGFNANTINATGAMGLMALQPRTAKELGVQDPFAPNANVNGGTRLLSELLSRFNGDISLTLAAYNAGPNAVIRFHGVPPFPETTDYVKNVSGIYSICKPSAKVFPPGLQPSTVQP